MRQLSATNKSSMLRDNNFTNPARTGKELIVKTANITFFAVLSYRILPHLANLWLSTEIDGWSSLKDRSAVFAARVSTDVEFWHLIGLNRQTTKVNPLLKEQSSTNGIKKVYKQLFRIIHWELSLCDNWCLAIAEEAWWGRLENY